MITHFDIFGPKNAYGTKFSLFGPNFRAQLLMTPTTKIFETFIMVSSKCIYDAQKKKFMGNGIRKYLWHLKVWSILPVFCRKFAKLREVAIFEKCHFTSSKVQAMKINSLVLHQVQINIP